MSAWDWTMLIGALASIAGVALFFLGRASTPPTPPVERIEPSHPASEHQPEPAPQPTGNQITATNVTDSEIIGGSRGTQPRNANPNTIKATNVEGSTIVGGNDRS